MRLTLLLLAAALALPAAAAAHVTIAPPFVEAGVATEISITVPNERAPHATVALEATMPVGISIVSTTAPEGWTATVDGSTVTWSGGRIDGRVEVVFPVRIEATVRAGTYSVAARQRYDDGADVRWKSDLSVLPASGEAAPDQRPWLAIVAGVVGTVVIVGSLLVLHRLRR
ncbi:MAG: YcnI family protein [Thermoleophilia bacterium]|nr:YcnI family protein [Thermoleophilia bacterium]